MPTVAEFKEDFRTDMADPAKAGMAFTETAIARWRKKAIRHLYKVNVAQEVTNYSGVYTDMPLANTTSLDYALGATWLRVTRIEYWENTANTMHAATSALWDDRARTGYVRILDAPDYANYRIMLFGLAKWGDVTDATMPDEVYDLVLITAELFATKYLASKRAASRKTNSAADVSLGAEVMWIRELKKDYKEAVKLARQSLGRIR
jgi:hypothetical protein